MLLSLSLFFNYSKEWLKVIETKYHNNIILPPISGIATQKKTILMTIHGNRKILVIKSDFALFTAFVHVKSIILCIKRLYHRSGNFVRDSLFNLCLTRSFPLVIIALSFVTVMK